MERMRIVLNKWITGAALVMVAATASAQTPRRSEAEQVRARQKISMMEGVLERAVTNGAENLFRQVRAAMPTSDGPRLIGAPEVRGFTLEGFGVFFDVEVPDLMMPPAWSLRYMVDQNGMAANTALGELKAMVATLRDPEQRDHLMVAINRLELQVGPAQPQPGAGVTRAAATQARATTAAQTVTTPAPGTAASPDVMDDPNEGYTREVRGAIVDAMIENTGAIPIGPEEWLMVAARGNVRPDRLAVTDNSDSHTIMLRVKGSDLAAFRSGSITLDEARKRVDIREY